jgi:hypothetical protein
MNPIDPKLIGSWISLDELDESEDGDYSPAIFTISAGKDSYDLAAVSPEDGEAAKFSNVTWDGKTLSFDCIFPSTDYPTKQALTLQPNGDATAEYTIWETWKKVAPESIKKSPRTPAKASMPANPDGPPINPGLIGIWVTEDEDSEATFSVSQGKDGYEVAGFDRDSGDSFGIKDVAWNGVNLSFEVYLDEDELLSKNTFTLLADGTAKLQLTLFDIWTRVAAVEIEE